MKVSPVAVQYKEVDNVGIFDSLYHLNLYMNKIDSSILDDMVVLSNIPDKMMDVVSMAYMFGINHNHPDMWEPTIRSGKFPYEL